MLCMARAECTGFELRRSLSSAFGKPTWVARKSTSWLQINLPGEHEVLAMFMLICDQGEESNRCSYWMGDTLSPSPAKGIHCYSKVGCLTWLVKQLGGCELSKFWGLTSVPLSLYPMSRFGTFHPLRSGAGEEKRGCWRGGNSGAGHCFNELHRQHLEMGSGLEGERFGLDRVQSKISQGTCII